MISKNKKLISFLLVLCMMMTILPMAAFAEDGDAEDVVTVTIPVHKFVSSWGNVTPGAIDFTVSMQLVDEAGTDVSDSMGLVVTDNIISTDGEHMGNNYTEESISFTIPEAKYADLFRYTLLVKENAVDEKGWVVDPKPIKVSFGRGTTEDGLTFDCDGGVVDNLNYIYLSNNYTIYDIEIPVKKTVKVIGEGTAPEKNFTFSVYPVSELSRNNVGYITGTISGEEYEDVTGNTVATNGADEYTTTVKVRLDGTELTENGATLLITEDVVSDADWTYLSNHVEGWMIDIKPVIIASDEPFTLPSYQIEYYRVDVDDNGNFITIGTDPVEEQVAAFENTYTAPVNYTIEIPFTKEVKQGGNTAPGNTNFEFELLLPPGYQGKLNMKVEGTTVATNGKGTYEGTLLITVDEDHLQNLTEGMVLVEKNTGKANWTYDDTAWFIGLYPIEVNALDEDRTTVSAPSYELGYLKAEKVTNDDGSVSYEATNDRADVITFTNTFTNTYTYNKTYSGGGSYSPSKPVLNKEDHFAFMSGYPDGTFGPGRNITRGEAAAMFARLLTESMELGKVYPNTFSDVPSDLWSANSIGYVQKFGLIAGYEDGTFRPNAPITRAEFAAIACRFENLTKGNAMFKDVPDTHWAANAINFAATRGWVGGYEDGTFRPNAYITRAEVVSVTCRLLERNADASFITENYAKLPHTYSDVNKGHWAFYSVMEASNGHDYTMKNKAETWTALHK